jgi:hypothetical protein
MSTSEIPARRRIERRELITLFCSLKPGEEISPGEILTLTGLDIRQAGDRSLCWNVREHCRDVIGFCIEYTKDGNLARVTDNGVVSGLLPKRRQRIYRQMKRGVAESMAIENFDALSHEQQLRLLAYQSTFETIGLVSQPKATKFIASALAEQPAIAMLEAESVVAAVRAIKQ